MASTWLQRTLAAAVTLTSIALAGCGPSATPHPAPSPSVSLTVEASPSPAATDASTPSAAPAPSAATVAPGAADPVSAVRQVLPVRAGSSSPCYTARAWAAPSCPVTNRFRARVASNPTAGANPVCRCQNDNGAPRPQLQQAGPATATVSVDFGFPSGPNVVRFTVVSAGQGWRVDDTDCGDATTSFFVNPVKGCFR